MAKEGLDFVPVEIGATDSNDKLFALLFGSDDPAADYGRYVLLLGQIYANGWAIKLDGRKALMVVQKLFFSSLEDFDAYIGRCVEVELFDRGLWESERVLTSKGIQRRFLSARKVSKKTVSGPWSLIDRDSPRNPEICRDSPKSAEICRDSPKSAEICRDSPRNAEPYIREEEDKEEDKEEVKEEEEDEEESGSSSDEGSAENPTAARPLACMAKPQPNNSAFTDSNGVRHDLPIAAVQGSYEAVGGLDFAAFAKRVSGCCLPGCRGHPGQACECFDVVMRSFDKFDPDKAADPWPLTKTMLEQDRKQVAT